MKLSILIATLGTRHTQFAGLVDKLTKQAEQYPGEIEIVAYWNNGELSIGEIRQRLLEEARGEYICFVDDDDDVPDYYCTEIMAHLSPDYVGFMVDFWHDNRPQRPVFHSIKYPNWTEDGNGYYRGITHLNPIKRSIAVEGNFTGGAGEDEAWATQVAPLVKNESYIDRHMYHYYHFTDKTSFGGEVDTRDPVRADIKHPNFRYITTENQ